MDEESRPNPEHLLAQAEAEARQSGRGRLKVFLGYAAGVGKTYAMLSSARERKAEGADVVAGLVETHARADTDALLEGLEVIPRRTLRYRDASLQEMDLDAVLSRKPGIALVDELAHTNAPGSRHARRYQDVTELLEHGIDVYTTLNIQHLESLNDVVAQITGVTVRETVPDSILEEAEIEVVDLPPDELLLRLQDGKVYVPDQARRAIERFFRKGNLTALREMLLRRGALRVDEQMRAYMQMRSIRGPWPAGERVVVCVSPSPTSERLVRGAKRLADELRADWFAVYVETPQGPACSGPAEERLATHLRLAEELGARSVRISAPSVAEGIVRFAEDHNVTKIIVGKPLLPRWSEALSGSVVDRIVRRSGQIDVYFISGAQSGQARPSRRPLLRGTPASAYLLSAALVGLATALGWPFHLAFRPTNLVMIYLAAVVVAALYLGRGPALLASILSVTAFDFFFIAPRFTFTVEDTEYLVTFAGLLVVGLVVSALTSRVRNQMDAVRRREAETSALYAFSRDLVAAVGQSSIVDALLAHIRESYDRSAVVLIPGPDGLTVAGSTLTQPLGEDELAVAAWALRHNHPAGAGTDTLAAADLHHVPLRTHQGVVGVMAVEPVSPWSPQQERALEAVASQAALAMERARFAEEARNVEVLRATERMQSALLNAVSHQLRTPLASVTGVLSALRSGGDEAMAALDAGSEQEMLDIAWEQVEHLNWLVGNLLDMTRLDAGAVRLKSEPCDLQDVVGVCLSQLARRLAGRRVDVDIAPELPLVPLDFVLITQVINNLLDNASRYSPPDTPIELRVSMAAGLEPGVLVSVRDHGPGLSRETLSCLFDRFQPVDRPEGGGGAGLGLPICKAIVDLHGGQISAENHLEGGASFSFTLPLERARQSQSEADQ